MNVEELEEVVFARTFLVVWQICEGIVPFTIQV